MCPLGSALTKLAETLHAWQFFSHIGENCSFAARLARAYDAGVARSTARPPLQVSFHVAPKLKPCRRGYDGSTIHSYSTAQP